MFSLGKDQITRICRNCHVFLCTCALLCILQLLLSLGFMINRVWHKPSQYSTLAGELMEKLNNSMNLSDVKVDDYLAVYIPGGHGKDASYPHV